MGIFVTVRVNTPPLKLTLSTKLGLVTWNFLFNLVQTFDLCINQTERKLRAI